MKAETIAINTASPSPKKPKLKPRGNSKLNCRGASLIERGKAINDKVTEMLTRINAAIFLDFFEIVVNSGRINAPAIGVKTIKDKISLAFIQCQFKKPVYNET